jgi:hypothetical protein
VQSLDKDKAYSKVIRKSEKEGERQNLLGQVF